MAVQETLAPLPANTSPIDHLQTDPNVSVPKHVRDAAAHADAIHKQAYTPEPAPAAEPDPVVAAPEPAAPQHSPEPAPQPQPQPQSDFTSPATPAEVQSDSWASRYNSMRGRWEERGRQLGAMQEQMNQMAEELQRTQALLLARPSEAQQEPQQAHRQLITDGDREQFGDELIDLTRRAALEAVSPELDTLRAENANLKKRVVTTAQGELKQTLAARVPDWQTINRSPDFKRWLSLRNIYTGEIRGRELSAAYAAADAPKVIAFFTDFINEVKATGGELPGARQEQQQVEPAAAPRTPAIQLETLAAPGRARPAGGDATLPADKPTYTRAQIASFYANVRRGAYAGRETDKARVEADIIAAQSEGRVRG